MIVAPPVAGDAHRLHRQEHRERLADGVVESVPAKRFDEDGIRPAQDVGVLLPDLAEDAHAEARSGKGVAIDHLGRQAEIDADATHLVLEQLPERLDQLQLHVLGKTADVVV